MKLLPCILLFNLISQFVQADINIIAPYVRATPPEINTSAAFMELSNPTDKAIKLLSVSTTEAQIAELHNHTHDNGIMKMRQVEFILIPPMGAVKLQPGGFHIMLMGLQQAMKKDKKVELNLYFSNHSSQTIKALVR